MLFSSLWALQTETQMHLVHLCCSWSAVSVFRQWVLVMSGPGSVQFVMLDTHCWKSATVTVTFFVQVYCYGHKGYTGHRCFVIPSTSEYLLSIARSFKNIAQFFRASLVEITQLVFHHTSLDLCWLANISMPLWLSALSSIEGVDSNLCSLFCTQMSPILCLQWHIQI